MKKITSLLLLVMIVLSLPACGGNETATDNDNGTSTTQNQTDVTDTSSTEQSTDTSSSTTDNIGGSDSIDVPSSTTSKPTTTTKPETSKPTTTTEPETSKPSTTTKPSTPNHTHSYSDATCTAPAKCSCGATNGNALGHSYSNADCTNPKKCSRCGVTSGSALGHSYSNGVCSRCGSKDSNYVKTYSVGETWIVDGQWEFTIHSAKKHYMCNSYSDHNGMAECVIITYSYKNLGYTGTFQDLYVNTMSFDVYDGDGEAAETYPCTHTTSAKVCSVGTKCSNAQEAYALYNNSSQLTLIFEHYTSNGLGRQKAKFEIPIS